MNKLLLPTLLLLAIIVNILPNQAQTVKKISTQQTFSWTNFTLALLSNKPPIQPRKRGSRAPGSVCMISPDAPTERRIVWSDRPTFIWKGSVQKIAVRIAGSHKDLWSQTVAGMQSENYTGKALQPGQTYEWLAFESESPSKFVQFQVMDAQQRDRITTYLNSVENQSKTKKVDNEAIALAKASYFVQNQLWVDALQQVYSVEKPSGELAQIRQEIPDKLCNSQ